mmetsp:Transcript_34333/g.70202  ORF Transcript_34333/g.70202 Transcript_34333/m.70202 type:complete len:217 (-) Transcript_34333:40-690(-)
MAMNACPHHRTDRQAVAAAATAANATTTTGVSHCRSISRGGSGGAWPCCRPHHYLNSRQLIHHRRPRNSPVAALTKRMRSVGVQRPHGPCAEACLTTPPILRRRGQNLSVLKGQRHPNRRQRLNESFARQAPAAVVVEHVAHLSARFHRVVPLCVPQNAKLVAERTVHLVQQGCFVLFRVRRWRKRRAVSSAPREDSKKARVRHRANLVLVHLSEE